MQPIWRRLAGLMPNRPRRRRDGKPLAIHEFADHKLCTIDAIDFIGRYALSPDRRYRLIWSDRDPARRIGGSRASGHGRWHLLERERPILEGRAERPSDGQVADNGTVLIADAFFGDSLECRLSAYRADGSRILERDFAANLVDCAISSNGAFAICQTANAPGSRDSCQYFLFDLTTGIECARWPPETGWASSYQFDTDNQILYLIDGDGERAAYRFDGTMANRAEWQKSRIIRGDLRVIRILFEANEAHLSKSRADLLLAGCDNAIAKSEIYDRARALRLRGEILEQQNDEGRALAAYEEALLRDPQVGVARRADKLRKKAASSQGKQIQRNMSRLERQAERLTIDHEVVALEHDKLGKAWRFGSSGSFVSIKFAALEHYRAQGWEGAAAEGGLILTLIKAASFAKLPKRHADTFIEALYAQNVAFAKDRYDPAGLVSAITRADRTRIVTNWAIIAAATGNTPRFYPQVERKHVLGLFDAIGRARLAAIAEQFARAPYDLRAGWPDLTLWRGNEVRFVEVKSPSDSIHAKQAHVISTILVPLGFSTALAEIRPA